jgi:hypothetical protein
VVEIVALSIRIKSDVIIDNSQDVVNELSQANLHYLAGLGSLKALKLG